MSVQGVEVFVGVCGQLQCVFVVCVMCDWCIVVVDFVDDDQLYYCIGQICQQCEVVGLMCLFGDQQCYVGLGQFLLCVVYFFVFDDVIGVV